MNELSLHRVDRINVDAYQRQNANGEPYRIIKIKIYSKVYGNIEIVAFGVEEEPIVITYGDE